MTLWHFILFCAISVFVILTGKELYEPTKCCTELKKFDDGKRHFDGKNYYQRRMARPLPMFYFSNLVMIPICYFSRHPEWNEDPPTFMGNGLFNTEWLFYVEMVFVCSSWFSGAKGTIYRLNGPSWFVSTIWFFYWIFPSLLPRLQRIGDINKGTCVFMEDGYWYFVPFGTRKRHKLLSSPP